MCVYLRVKFVVSSIILTSFRQGLILHLLPPPSPPRPTQSISNRAPKNPTQIRDNHHQKGSVSNITFINMCLVWKYDNKFCFLILQAWSFTKRDSSKDLTFNEQLFTDVNKRGLLKNCKKFTWIFGFSPTVLTDVFL